MIEIELGSGQWRCSKCHGVNEPDTLVCACNNRARTPETFEEAIDTILGECRKIMLSKRQDYGTGNIEGFGELGVLIRVNDKVARLKNLLYDNPGTPKNESLYDSWLDIANYAVLALMVRRGHLKLPLAESQGSGS